MMDDNSIMPFGKYKGQKLANVPASYLLWLDTQLKRDDWPDLQTYIYDNREALEKEVKAEQKYK